MAVMPLVWRTYGTVARGSFNSRTGLNIRSVELFSRFGDPDYRYSSIVEDRTYRYRRTMAAKKGIRVLGGKNVRPKWDRFNRLQINAQALAGDLREPKGVHRFKTWEEFNEWKMKYQVQRESQPRATS